MGRLSVLVLIASLAAAPALAQTSTTTTCHVVGNQLNCDSTTLGGSSPPQPDWRPVADQVRNPDLGAAMREAEELKEARARTELLQAQTSALEEQQAELARQRAQLAAQQAQLDAQRAAQQRAEGAANAFAARVAQCVREHPDAADKAAADACISAAARQD
jgi:hypothetical protein